MKKEFCQQLLKDEQNAHAIALAFRDFLREVYKTDEGILFRTLFVQKIPVNRARLPGKEAQITTFLNNGLLVAVDEKSKEIRSGIMVHRNIMDIEAPELNPSTEWFIATDWPDIPPDDEEVGEDMVFPIHYESIYLLKTLNEDKSDRSPSGKDVLDMFCGSGIFGIYCALSDARSVICSDINDRALAFTRFNSILNGIADKVALSQGDLFEHTDHESLSGKSFDLILANPPFEPVPAPAGYYKHSQGGPFGHDILQPFLNQVSGYLKPDGRLLIVTFSCGDEALPSILALQQAGEYEEDQHIALDMSKSQCSGTTDIVDSIPLSEFAIRFHHLHYKDADISKWLTDLEQCDLSRLYLVCMDLKNDSAENVVQRDVSKVPPTPCDWTIPLEWGLPCGLQTLLSREKKGIKVLLVDPPMHKCFERDMLMHDFGRHLDIPSNMLSLGTYLRARFPKDATIELLHSDYVLKEKKDQAQIDKDDFQKILRERIEKEKPDIIGIGAYTIQADFVLGLLKGLKQKLSTRMPLTVGGGPHITFCYQNFFDEGVLDFAVMGEGEYAMEDILRGCLLFKTDSNDFQEACRAYRDSVQAGRYSLPRNALMEKRQSPIRRSRVNPIHMYPTDYALLPGDSVDFLRQANAYVFNKRGCSHACEFCISGKFLVELSRAGKRIRNCPRVRPIHYTLADIRYIFQKAEQFRILLFDETFYPHPSSPDSGTREDYLLCQALAGDEFRDIDIVIQTRGEYLTSTTLPILKAARVSTILVGCESASEDILSFIHKGETFAEISEGIEKAKDWSFAVGAFWMEGLPAKTQEDSKFGDQLSQDVRDKWTKEGLVLWHEINKFIPYPGTAFFKQREAYPLGLTPETPYSEWHRFGEDSKHHPTPESIPQSAHLLDRLQKRSSYQFASELATHFEQKLAKREETPQGDNKHPDDQMSTMVPKVFAHLVDDCETRNALPLLELFFETALALSGTQLFDMHSCFVLPFSFSESKLRLVDIDRQGAKGYVFPLEKCYDKQQGKWHFPPGDRLKNTNYFAGCDKDDDDVLFLYQHTSFYKFPFLRSSQLTKHEKNEGATSLRWSEIVGHLKKSAEKDEGIEDVSSRWAIGIALRPRRPFTFAEVDAYCKRASVYPFFVFLLDSLFNTLAALLELELTDDEAKEEIKAKQYHLCHDFKNVLLKTAFLRAAAQRLKDKSAIREANNIATNKNEKIMRYEKEFEDILKGNPENFDYGLEEMAYMQERLNRIVEANVELFNGHPEQIDEDISSGNLNLAGLFLNDFFRHGAIFKRGSQEFIIRSEDKENKLNLTATNREEAEKFFKAVFNEQKEKHLPLPRSILFDIVIPELLTNARCYSPPDSTIEIVTGIIDFQEKPALSFFVTNESLKESRSKSKRSQGLGTGRIREALSVNLSYKMTELLDYKLYLPPTLTPKKNPEQWRSGFVFPFKRYSQVVERFNQSGK